MEEKISSIGVVNNFRTGKGLFSGELGSPQKSTKVLKNKPVKNIRKKLKYILIYLILLYLCYKLYQIDRSVFYILNLWIGMLCIDHIT